MILFSNILGRVRGIYASRFEPEGIRRLADIWWRTLIVTACMLAVFALVFGLWNFFSVVTTLAAVSGTSPLPPAAVSPATLHTLAAGFDARQTQFDALASNPPPPVPDPSR